MNDKYALDANILISSSRLFYPFDVAPAFWRQLAEKAPNRIILVDRIKDEILRNEDVLTNWLRKNMDLFVNRASSDMNVIDSYRRIISYVNGNLRYKESAKSSFAESADSWLCAHALAYFYVVVTEEIYEPNIRKEIKIPNVCREFNIRCINRLQFIRKMGIRFE